MGRAGARSDPGPVLALLLAFVGVFALVGGLYSWGEGPIWAQADGPARWLQVTDLAVTTPLCWLAGWAIWRRKAWTGLVVAMASGVLLYGSVAVFVQLVVAGPPYPMAWILPPIGGLALAAALVRWLVHGPDDQPPGGRCHDPERRREL